MSLARRLREGSATACAALVFLVAGCGDKEGETAGVPSSPTGIGDTAVSPTDTSDSTEWAPEDGLYRLFIGATRVDECGIVEGGGQEDEALLMDFTVREAAGSVHVDMDGIDLDCGYADRAFECVLLQMADTYQLPDGAGGMDEAHYTYTGGMTGQWVEPTRIEGEFVTSFDCEGDGCEALAREIGVPLPCDTRTIYTGERWERG